MPGIHMGVYVRRVTLNPHRMQQTSWTEQFPPILVSFELSHSTDNTPVQLMSQSLNGVSQDLSYGVIYKKKGISTN